MLQHSMEASLHITLRLSFETFLTFTLPNNSTSVHVLTATNGVMFAAMFVIQSYLDEKLACYELSCILQAT